jgi:hypothetical protein
MLRRLRRVAAILCASLRRLLPRHPGVSPGSPLFLLGELRFELAQLSGAQPPWNLGVQLPVRFSWSSAILAAVKRPARASSGSSGDPASTGKLPLGRGARISRERSLACEAARHRCTPSGPAMKASQSGLLTRGFGAPLSIPYGVPPLSPWTLAGFCSNRRRKRLPLPLDHHRRKPPRHVLRRCPRPMQTILVSAAPRGHGPRGRAAARHKERARLAPCVRACVAVSPPSGGLQRRLESFCHHHHTLHLLVTLQRLRWDTRCACVTGHSNTASAPSKS